MTDIEEKKYEAYTEIAKAAHKALDVSHDGGKFLRQVFGDLVIDSVGLLADRLKFIRIENQYILAHKTQAKLEAKGIKITQPVEPKIALPLIEAASIEDDKTLQDKWANMLANAMNPDYAGKINRSFISILEDMEAIDVLIFDHLIEEEGLIIWERNDILCKQILFENSKISEKLKINQIECDISLNNLIRLGCLKRSVFNSADAINSKDVSLSGYAAIPYQNTEMVVVTSLGIEFHNAVSIK